MDEFIDRLLASKKFDVLVDKIAQKAVDRMIEIKRDLNVNTNITEQMNYLHPISLQNVSYKTDIHLGETPLMKNLSLKYKYFTKPAFYNINSNENNDNVYKELDETVIKNSSVADKNLGIEDDESINISDLESSLHDKPEGKAGYLKDKDIQGEAENISGGNKPLSQNENDGSISIENKKNFESLSENELPEDHKRNDVSSDFDRKVKKDGVLFNNNEHVNDNKVNKRRENRIHREGNRVYTFRSSPDYEEYHQELDRVEEQRQVFV